MPGNKKSRNPPAKTRGSSTQSLNVQIETIQITKVTLTDGKGIASANYTTGGNVTLTRAQQIITELIIESAKREGKAEAIKAKTIVTGGEKDGKESRSDSKND